MAVASLTHPHRVGRRLLGACALAGVLALALVLIPAPPAGAQETGGGSRVGAQGLGSFDESPTIELEGVPGCRFAIDALVEEEVTLGTFRCAMSEEAASLGVPFASLDGTVDEASDLTARRAILSGTATLILPDGQVMDGVTFIGRVVEGRDGAGGMLITLLDVFDGAPGDATVADGHYVLPWQVVSVGFIRVRPAPEPEPEPDPEPDPEPEPEPDPEPDPEAGDGNGQGGPSPSLPGPIPQAGTYDPPFVVSGTNSTARLMATLAQISPLGTPRPDDVLSVVSPFPVAGLAWWQDDWHAYRCCPYEHVHQGLDLFAARGTPVVAAADGVVSQKVNGSVSGLAVEVTDGSGTQYFYAHLDAFATGLHPGQSVSMGEVLGFVGSTGNARGTSSHLHFEIQPGGIPVPPKPIVDRWLILAEIRAEALVEQVTGAEVESDGGLLPWLNRAELLAGDSWGEVAADLPDTAIEAAPVSSSIPVSSGSMALFATGMLLLLLVGPGVVAGRRQAAARHRPVKSTVETLPDRSGASRLRAAR